MILEITFFENHATPEHWQHFLNLTQTYLTSFRLIALMEGQKLHFFIDTKKDITSINESLYPLYLTPAQPQQLAHLQSLPTTYRGGIFPRINRRPIFSFITHLTLKKTLR